MTEVCFHSYPDYWPWTRRSRRRFRRRREKIAWSVALRDGFKRHGIKTRLYRPGRPLDSDIHVFWGWHEPQRCRALLDNGQHSLILERGFLQPRRGWASVAFDGLNGRGRFAGPADGGERFQRHFGHLLSPWQSGDSATALVIGQVPGDAALHGTDIAAWAADMSARLQTRGWQVVYRSHPLAPTPCPTGAERSEVSLAADLARAGLVVTYNSTTGVEAVLAGVPTHTDDHGSMAWPMASHALDQAPVRPDRKDWCRDLAWKQWQAKELADGSAWAHLRQVIGA